MTSLADFLRCALALLAASLLAACQPSGVGDSEKKSAVVPQASSADGTAGAPAMPQEFEADGIMPKRYSVVPYGYNYTDNYISSFSVNGAGGGNLEVSIPTAGGGGHDLGFGSTARLQVRREVDTQPQTLVRADRQAHKADPD